MKSTKQRDLYAEELDRYRKEVPLEQWPVYGRAVSRSGLERALKARGLVRFERKRLHSSKCRPILKEMDDAVRARLGTQVKQEPVTAPAPTSVSPDAEVCRLQRRIAQLERDLRNAERREAAYRKRCALLEAEVEDVRRRHDAFEQHCHASLRTLHV